MNGIVIEQGRKNKTLKVRCWWRSFYYREKYFMRKGSNYLVHDEENFCRIGDVVRIVQAGNITKDKHYYVNKVLHQGPRFELWNNNQEKTFHKALTKEYHTVEEKSDVELKRMKVMRD